MGNVMRNLFIALSNNKILNEGAKRWGVRLGADQFVAGTDVNSAIQTVKRLNKKGLSCTVDKLGEFVTDRSESLAAKEKILTVLENIHTENIDCHISVKLTQLG